jgi:teichuronic acid biosynthesis glycosyltransferase TuaG
MSKTSEQSGEGKKGLVSVVIPAFRARRYIAEALESVRAQTYSSWEVIVVDDCSPEPVDDLVKTFAATVPRNCVRLIRHSENKGLGAARNTGILAAAGEYVAFLDHDDVWRKTHLEDAIKMLKSEKANFAYCDFEVFQKKAGDLPQNPDHSADFWGKFPASLYVHNFMPPSGVVLCKQTLEKLELFATAPELHMCEDLDLWLRAAGQGVKFARVRKPNLLYRKHLQAATSNLRIISSAKAHVLCRNVKTVSEVPLRFRRQRACIACVEAAKECRTNDPAWAAYFYLLSFQTDRKRLKHLCIAAYYLIISFCNRARKIFNRH